MLPAASKRGARKSMSSVCHSNGGREHRIPGLASSGGQLSTPAHGLASRRPDTSFLFASYRSWMYTQLLVGPPTVRNSTWILASTNHLWMIRLPVCGTTSRIPSRSRCHAEGPSSLSHSFSFILAHESMLLPSNSTTAPTGGFMPSDGGVRVTCCRSKVSWPLEALKWPVLIVPFHSPPVKVTVSPDRAPCITATGLSLGTSNWRKMLA